MRGVEKVTIIFNEVNLPSFNKFYSQEMKARQRHQTVWKWKLIFSTWLRQQLTTDDREFLKNTQPLRVDVTIHKAKSTRWFDVDNCVMYGKLFLDTLKVMKLIKDDNPNYIKTISYTVEINSATNKVVYEISKA